MRPQQWGEEASATEQGGGTVVGEGSKSMGVRPTTGFLKQVTQHLPQPELKQTGEAEIWCSELEEVRGWRDALLPRQNEFTQLQARH